MPQELIYYRHNKSALPPLIPKLRIKFYDVTLLLSGSLTYIIDGQELTFSAGDAIALPENCFRERLPSTSPADFVSYNFTGDDPKLPMLMKRVAGSEIKLLTAALDEITADLPASAQIQPAALVFSSILFCIRRALEKKTSDPVADKIESYLLQNYAQKITLNDIARLTYFSATHCDVIFKRAKGKSIIAYLLDLRMDEAKKLLIEGALSLTDVAYAVGFNDYNYFSRLFKSRVGYSPTVYRHLVLQPSNHNS